MAKSLVVIAVLLGHACATGQAGARKGVEFNGSTSYAIVRKGAAFDLDAFSLALWVKVRRSGRPQIFLSRGAAGKLFTLYAYTKGVRMLVEHQPPKYTHAIAPFPKKGVWTHYAGTYDGTAIRIYMNGQLKATTKAPGRIARSRAPLFIGALDPYQRHLDGELDDVRIWRRALTDAEAASLAAGDDRPSLNDGLAARWAKDTLKDKTWENAAMAELPAEYLADPKLEARRDTGYRGIWYSNQRQKNEYVYKYSGGLGTYCAKHAPFAVYAKEADKTFFCYGGVADGGNSLLHMVSYFDHKTATVPRPIILLDKRTTDAHDNPVISLDDKGHIWIFSSSHGTSRPSFISVSTKPYDISEFERVLTTNFSYTQPWHIKGKGFVFVHTIYRSGRCNYVATSPDGRTWTKPTLLAKIEMGHYQVSRSHGARVGTAFNFHPSPKGLNWRTNLYYMETDDFAQTWHNAQGEKLDLPLTTKDNPALVHNYQADGLNVYLKQLAFDDDGRPVILFVTSKGWEAGPENAPRHFRTARWTGTEWDIPPGSVPCDNNYDTGSLYIEKPGLWRLIAPTHVGPQPFNPGGEIAMWTSADRGHTWTLVKQLTRNSPYNHTYARRPVNAHPAFYALWADGHGRRPSESSLYFCDQAGNVFRLPRTMAADAAKPEPCDPATRRPAPDGGAPHGGRL